MYMKDTYDTIHDYLTFEKFMTHVCDHVTYERFTTSLRGGTRMNMRMYTNTQQKVDLAYKYLQINVHTYHMRIHT